MYKLLLVSDQEDVLNAFSRIQNWELIGLKAQRTALRNIMQTVSA